MAKTAMIGVRVDEALKDEAQKVLGEMGLPMSLAIEVFLRQVVEKRRLPFAVGLSDAPDPEREEQERQFWQKFIAWSFDVWPRFDSIEIEYKAMGELGFAPLGPGDMAETYIQGGSRDLSMMNDDQRYAYSDVLTLRSLLSDAKELIYWALGMEKLFVPGLAAKYADEADQWRWQRAWAENVKSMWVADLAKTGMLVAGSVGTAGSPSAETALPDEKLMDLYREWLAGRLGDETDIEPLERLAQWSDDPDEIREALEDAGLLDDFECYVMEKSGEAQFASA